MNFNLKQQLKDKNIKVLAALMLWFRKSGGNGHIAGIYDSGDPATIKMQCANAKAAGYAGFALDLYPDQFKIALAVLQECKRQGLEISIMLEGRYGLPTLNEQMKWIRDNFITGNQLYSRIDGKPLIWEFGFRENGVDLAAFCQANPDVMLLCQSHGESAAPHSYGWVNLSPGYAQRVNPNVDVPGLWWQFDDKLASWGTGRKLPANNGAVLRECLDSINGTGKSFQYALVSTWNDYEEGTAIEKEVAAQLARQPATMPKPDYQANISAAGDWLAKTCIASDGAILFGADTINPYHGNLAAIGMCKNPANWPQVMAWMTWYVGHLNCPDKWGMAGTIYDYSAVGVQSHEDADSTDSYAATFLSLAWAFYQTGDPRCQAFIKRIIFQIEAAGQVLVRTQQADGCTWAKPDYQIKYLMDNCEAYRGMRDFALLLGALGITASQKYYDVRADLMLTGIMTMWMFGTWATEKDGLTRANLAKWYPDATAQLFPILQGVILPGDTRAQQTYAQFLKAWPAWEKFSFNAQDPFPWVLVALAAAIMGDNVRVDAYIGAVQEKYVKVGFPWPFYCAEAGWFMRLNARMLGQ